MKIEIEDLRKIQGIGDKTMDRIYHSLREKEPIKFIKPEQMIVENTIYNENCLVTMDRMPDNYLDLTVTSPPYDNLRDYNGYDFDFESIAKELYRVTKEGGVVVWVVGDATVKGSETGTSFKQALFFKQCGFRLHDTMIWNKKYIVPRPSNRYENSFEYMFVFSKYKPKSVALIKDKSNVGFGRKITGGIRDVNGVLIKSHGVNANKTIAEFGTRHNVWVIDPSRGKHSHNHPASFPEQLANDHIISWSNPDDIVYDPFGGSGTTAKMALKNNRKFITSEISEEYCDIIEKRIK